MKASATHITAIVQLFEIFLQTRLVASSLQLEAHQSLLKILQQSNSKETWPGRQTVLKLAKSSHNPTQALVLSFLTTYPPFETAVMLNSWQLALIADDCSLATVKNYRSDIRQFIDFHQELSVVKLLQKPKVLSYLKSQATSQSKSTLTRKLSSITQFAKFAQDQGWAIGVHHQIGKLNQHSSVTIDGILKEATQPSRAGWLSSLKKPLATLQSTRDKTNNFPGCWQLPTDDWLKNQLDQFPQQTRQTTHQSASDLHTTKNSSSNQLSSPNLTKPSSSSQTSRPTALHFQDARSRLSSRLLSLSQQLNRPQKNQWLPWLSLGFALLALLGIGYFGYQQFGQDPDNLLAYPTTLKRPNRSFSFQGRLTDTAKNPIVSATNMQFKLYTVVTGGTEVWDSGVCSIDPDQDGIFSTNLGSDCGTEITEDVFSQNSNVWLEVTVASEILAPRQPIKTVAYALNSETLQGYPASASAVENTVLVMNNNGEVVLGNTSPVIKSTGTSFALEAQTMTIRTSTGSDGDIVIDPDDLGDLIVLGNIDAQAAATISGNFRVKGTSTLDNYLSAPGATLSATYAGGTPLTLLAGPSATADILRWQTSTGSTLGVIDKSGNVGIGSTEPTSILDIRGGGWTGNLINVFNTSGGGTNIKTLYILNSGGNSGDLAHFVNQGLGNSLRVDDEENDSSPFIINSSGNVGIGTTTPDFKLQVDGTIAPETTDSDLGSSALRWDLFANTINADNTVTFSNLSTGGIVKAGSGTGLLTVGTISLTSEISGILPIANGGTNASTIGSAGSVPYSTGTAYGFSAVGNSGQCLLSGAGGVPTWGDCALATGTSKWQLAPLGGAISPYSNTLDILFGGTASSSAKFAFLNVNSGTPTASIAGNLAIAAPTGANPATKLNIYNGGTFGIRTSVGGDAGLAERLTILNNGNVGIGTTNPAYKLSLAGTSSPGDRKVGINGTQVVYLPDQTSFTGSLIVGDGGSNLNHSITFDGYNNSIFGLGSGSALTRGSGNSVLGTNALSAANTGLDNVAVGYNTLNAITWSSNNTAVGANAGRILTDGDQNTLLGSQTGYNLTDGADNIFVGYQAGWGITTGFGNVVVGDTADAGSGASGFNVSLGFAAGYNATGGNNNVMLGSLAGSNIGGSNNILVGYKAGDALTSGTNNIAIGYDIDLPSNTGSNQLSIGNLIFGTGLNGTGTTISTGNIGIGSTAPSQKLDVVGGIRLGTAGAGNVLNTSAGSAPTGNLYWGDRTVCDSGGSCGTSGIYSNWTVNASNGTINPNNNTLDVLFGGTASSSAKFAFLNVNSGTPTASIAGNLAIAAPTGANPATKLNVYNGGSFGIQTSVGGDVGLAERLTILNNGNVGIGTTIPESSLDVRSTTNASIKIKGTNGQGGGIGLEIDNTTTTTGRKYQVVNYDNGDFVFRNTAGAGNDFVRFNDSNNLILLEDGGNVGIGTTAPGNKLEISGTAVASELIPLRITNTNGDNGSGVSMAFQAVGGTAITGKIRNVRVGSSDYSMLMGPLNNFDALAIRTNGNVGIGTTAPGYLLEVVKNQNNTTAMQIKNTTDGTFGQASILVTVDDGTANSAIQLIATSASYTGIADSGDAGVITSGSRLSKGLIINANAGGIKFRYANADKMIIDTSGNVGIGTTNPLAKLQIGASNSSYGRFGEGNIDIGWNGDSRSFVSSNANAEFGVTAGRSGDGGIRLGQSNQFSYIAANGTSLILNGPGGNVGIGTTSPGAKLSFAAATNAAGGIDFGGDANLYRGGANNLTTDDNLTVKGAEVELQNANLRLYGTADITTSWGTSFDFIGYTGGGTPTTVASVDSSNFLLASGKLSGTLIGNNQQITGLGNVGIGTTAPAYNLQVSGDVKLSDGANRLILASNTSNPTGAAGAMYYDSANNKFKCYTTSWVDCDTVGSGSLPSGTNGQTLFNNAGSWSATSNLFNDGTNVGIGTSVPTALLDVAGTASASAFTIRGASPGYIDQLNGNDLIFRTSVGGNAGLTEQLTILNSGNVGIGTTSPTSKLSIQGTNSAASLGSELLTTTADRDFSSDSGNWTGTNWTISGGVATHTASANNFTHTFTPTAGKTYQVLATIVTTTAGSIDAQIGGTNFSPVGTNTGTLTQHSWVLTAANTTSLRFIPNSTWEGTIDDISVKEITQTSPQMALLDSNNYPFLEFRGITSSGDSENIALGRNSIMSNISGIRNTSLGSRTLEYNTTGNSNVAIGYRTLRLNTTGSGNSAVGQYSLLYNTTGSNNSAFGISSLSDNTTGSGNTASGLNALLRNKSGDFNVALGYTAMQLNTSGSNNTAVGLRALERNTTGSMNIALGYWAGRLQADGVTDLANPENSIYIGSGSRGYNNDDDNSIVIGYNAIGLGANTAVFGNDSITTTALKGNVGIGTTAPSQKLEVAGNMRTTGYLYFDNPTGSDLFIRRSAVNTMTLWAGSGPMTWQGTNLTLGQWGSDVTLSGPDAGVADRNGQWLNVRSGTSWGSGTAAGLKFFYSPTGTGGGGTNGYIEGMRLNGTGNVGIGTTAPTSLLDVAGTASVSALTILGASPGYIDQLNGNDLKIRTSVGGNAGLADRLTILNSGNVGIGTTSPAELLDVSASSPAIRLSSSYAAAVTALKFYNTTTYLSGVEHNHGSGEFKIGVFAGGGNFLTFHEDGNERMRLDSSGNVGIGTTSPGYKLDVNGVTNSQSGYYGSSGNVVLGLSGSANTLNNMSNAQSALTLTQGGAGAVEGALIVNTNAASPGILIQGASAQSADYFQVRSNGGSGGNIFAINSSGNVGIGTTSPATKFDLKGSSAGNIAQYINANDAINWGGVKYGFSEASGANEFGFTIGAYNTGGNKIVNLNLDGTPTEFSFTSASDDIFSFNKRFVALGGLIGDYHQDLDIILQQHTNGGADTGLNFKVNGGASTAMRILEGGNVGIGTTAPGALLQLGTAGTSLGTFRLTGNTSGYTQIQPSAAAGDWTLTLPANDGDNGQVLTTNGSGVTSWSSAGSGANTTLSNLGSVAVNTSLISDTDSTDDLGSSSIYWANTYTDQLYTTGNVGIGTTTATQKLDVIGITQSSGGFRTNSETVTDFTGNGLTLSSGAQTINLMSGVGTGSSSSGSGMEVTASGLGLLQNCADTEVLKWNEASSVWECKPSTYSKFVSTTNTNIVNSTGNTASVASTNVDVDAAIPAASSATQALVQLRITATNTTAANWSGHVMPTGVGVGTSNGVVWTGELDGAGVGYGMAIVALDANKVFSWGMTEIAGSSTATLEINVVGYWTPVTTGADLAENFYGSSSITAGDLVSLDPDLPGGVTTSLGKGDSSVIGVASSQPGMVLDEINDPNQSVTIVDNKYLDRVPVAVGLVGRVPVKVTTENGPIRPGDPITTSSIPGVGMRATSAGTIVGRALESYSSTDPSAVGQVLVFLNLGQYEPQYTLNEFGNLEIAQSETGEIAIIDTATPQSSPIADSLGVFTQAIIGQIEAGLVKTRELAVTGVAQVQKLVVSGPAQIADLSVGNLSVGGQTLRSYIESIVLESQSTVPVIVQVSPTPAISPLLSPTPGQTVIANTIETTNLIAQSINATGETSLGSLLVEGNAQILGDATVSGQTQLGTLLVDGDATVAGSLIADQVTTNQTTSNQITSNQLTTDQLSATSARITALEAGIAQMETVRATTAIFSQATVSGTLYADTIANLDQQIAAAMKQPSLIDVLFNNTPSNNDDLTVLKRLVDTAVTTASAAAQLDQSIADLNLNNDDVVITGQAAFINQYLKVNGTAYVADSLGVGNLLKVGSRLELTDTYLAFHADPSDEGDLNIFSIQPSGKGILSLMAGLLTLDETGTVTIVGNLKVAGDVEVRGTLLSNLIESSDPNLPVRIKVAGASTNIPSDQISNPDGTPIDQSALTNPSSGNLGSRFEIIGDLGQAVATVSGQGKISLTGGINIDSDSIARPDVQGAATNPDQLTQESTKTTGRATLPAGNTQLIIRNPNITADSLVYLTPLGSTNNQVLFVKQTTPAVLPPPTPQYPYPTPTQEAYFVVGLDTPAQSDITFTWWIVN